MSRPRPSIWNIEEEHDVHFSRLENAFRMAIRVAVLAVLIWVVMFIIVTIG